MDSDAGRSRHQNSEEALFGVVTKDLRLGATADCYRLARIWQARLMARFESNVAISAGSGGRCS
jgi:hypothetical protein